MIFASLLCWMFAAIMFYGEIDAECRSVSSVLAGLWAGLAGAILLLVDLVLVLAA